MSLSGAWYLGLAAVVFTIGAIGLLVRRNVLIMFMCIELMLNAANLTFVTFARMLGDIGGQAVVFFVLVVAAAEVVVGPGHRRHQLPPARHDRGRRPGLVEGLIHGPRRLPHAALPPGRLPACWSPSGRRMGDPVAGWIGTVAVAGSFVVALRRLRRPAGPALVATGWSSHNYFTWFQAGGLKVPVGTLVDPLSMTMCLFITGRQHADPPVLHRVHEGRPRLLEVLHLPEPLRLLHAPPGAGGTTCSHLRRVGGRRRLLLLARRLLVPAGRGGLGGQEGLHLQPHR